MAADDDVPVMEQVVDRPDGGHRVLGEHDAPVSGAGELAQRLLPGHRPHLPVTLAHPPAFGSGPPGCRADPLSRSGRRVRRAEGPGSRAEAVLPSVSWR